MTRHLIVGLTLLATVSGLFQRQLVACPIDDIVRELRADLQSEVEATRIDAVTSACELMVSQSYRGQAETLLLLALEDKCNAVRIRAAVSLSDHGNRDGRLRNVLLAAIGTPRQEPFAVRAAHALARVDPGNVAIPRCLLAALEKPPYNSLVVAGLLRTEPSHCKEAVEILEKILKARDIPQSEVDRVARYSADLGPAAAPLVPLLLARMEAEQCDILVMAHALSSIGPAASIAAPALVSCWENMRQDGDRLRLASAISSVGDTCTPHLLHCLDRADAASKYRIIQMLGNMRGECPRAVAALSRLADEGEVTVRAAAIVAISSLGPRADDAVKVLLRHIDDRAVVAETKQPVGGPLRFQPVDNEGPSVGVLSIYAIGMIGNASAIRQLELALAKRPQLPANPGWLGRPRDETSTQLLLAISRIKKRQKQTRSEASPNP